MYVLPSAMYQDKEQCLVLSWWMSNLLLPKNCTQRVVAENNIYYLTVIVGQDSGCSLSEACGSACLTSGCNHNVGCSCSFVRRLEWGRMCFKLTWLLAGFSVSQAVGLRASVPYWLLARVCPSFFGTWVSPQGSSLHGS